MGEEPQDLLVEIGTEELPPKTLRTLSESFGAALTAGLSGRGLEHGEVSIYATPRRLAVLVSDVDAGQPDRDIERRGPTLAAGFDADGNPTKAAHGFARSCGVEVEQLERLENDDGEWLAFRTTEVGESTPSLLPAVVEAALAGLPIARRMRWADLAVEFVRPVHWVVLLFGEEIVEANILGIGAGRVTRGHRFHHPVGIALDEPSAYAIALYGNGRVIAEFDARVDMIRNQVREAAAALGGRPLANQALLEEVAALVEWPVAITGSFDETFLELPDPVLIATLQGHQRYVPVTDENGALLPYFIAISNIESRDPESVRAGNERVIRPRLSDADFFFRADLGVTLDNRRASLEGIVFQAELGSMRDKADRVARLAEHVAIGMGATPEEARFARRAGELCKCDLVTEMVGEFPELQGEMGREYAERGGEPDAVSQGIGEVYRPRFAGDSIPSSTTGRAVAIADKLDTLVGIFGIGQFPTGDRDPFALRRAALGVLRILIEAELDMDLLTLIGDAVSGFDRVFESSDVAERVSEFMMDRLRAYFTDRDVPISVFTAVQARRPRRPFDFSRRVVAVDEFRQLPEAQSLSVANKRIQNILKQAGGTPSASIDDSLFAADAEWDLAAKVTGLHPRVKSLLEAGDYPAALGALASLRDSIDAFFDTVRVMDDDAGVRANRLALLNRISTLFLATADISKLQD